MYFSKRSKKSGFTLLEMVATVVIVGILSVVLVPRIFGSSVEAKKNACYQNKAEINSTTERWFFDKGAWPANDLSDISIDLVYFAEGVPACPVDASVYALDGTSHRVTGHTH